MVRSIIMFVAGVIWLLQGYIFGFQLPFARGNAVLVVLSQVTQGLALLGGCECILTAVFLLWEYKSSKKAGKEFENYLFYTILTVIDVVLVICTFL